MSFLLIESESAHLMFLLCLIGRLQCNLMTSITGRVSQKQMLQHSLECRTSFWDRCLSKQVGRTGRER